MVNDTSGNNPTPIRQTTKTTAVVAAVVFAIASELFFMFAMIFHGSAMLTTSHPNMHQDANNQRRNPQKLIHNLILPGDL